jgi:hypothetical protein
MSKELDKILGKLKPEEQELLLKNVTTHFDKKGKDRTGSKMLVSFNGSSVKVEKTKQSSNTNVSVDKVLVEQYKVNDILKQDIAKYTDGSIKLRDWKLNKEGKFGKHSKLANGLIPHTTVTITNESLEKLKSLKL